MQSRKYKFLTEQSQLNGVLQDLMSKPIWGLDLETTGKDPHTSDVVMAQIGRGDYGYVIDTRQVNISELNPFFESRNIKKIAHNAAFETKMLRGKTGARCENMRCTFLAEKILRNGLQFDGFGLGDVTLKRLGKVRDKTLQTSFLTHTGPFTEAQLQYGEDDVVDLNEIITQQSSELLKEGLGRIFLIECEAIPAFADMEYDGLPFDSELWRGVMYENKKRITALEVEMNRFAGSFIAEDMFGVTDINYGSPQQVLKVLKAMKIRDKVTGQLIEFTSTGEKALRDYKHINFIQKLEEWRSLTKMIHTYGESYINEINPATNRIHPNLWQIGTETGRPSSSGGANVLNIPKKPMYRRCFKADEGELIQTDDLAGCEPRILAHLSQDPFLMQIFREGRDIHCEVASFLFGIPVAKNEGYAHRFGLPFIPDNMRHRVPGKELNLGITYGMGVDSLYSNINAAGFTVTKEQTREMLYKYRSKLAFACGYIKECGNIASETGVIRNINGRKRHFRLPNESKFQLGKQDPDYKRQLSAIYRAGGNHPIQSVCSDIIKESMAAIRRFSLDNKIQMSFVNCVYDEIVTKTSAEDSESFHFNKLRIMKEVAEKTITTVPMLIESSVGRNWGVN